MTLGEKITKLRKDKNMSQEKLAEKMDVSRQTIYKWECDTVIPEREKLTKLTKLFKVSYDYLLDDEKNEVGKDESKVTIIQKKIVAPKTKEPKKDELGKSHVVVTKNFEMSGDNFDESQLFPEGSPKSKRTMFILIGAGLILAGLIVEIMFVGDNANAASTALIILVILGIISLICAKVSKVNTQARYKDAVHMMGERNKEAIRKANAEGKRAYGIVDEESYVVFDDKKKMFYVYQYEKQVLEASYSAIIGAAVFDSGGRTSKVGVMLGANLGGVLVGGSLARGTKSPVGVGMKIAFNNTETPNYSMLCDNGRTIEGFDCSEKAVSARYIENTTALKRILTQLELVIKYNER
ncbi:MAG: helix-turn-helix transcriptional regulator [Bacilli bacterium]|jgi:transcriptional regulator with XRE-family HTH domain|nr:helix-turn-helix transcriptional regulator [Bacilli bacterium]MDD3422141.1 helix-turn-helix transcriptional regulator [Bacilli bacterium]MDD4065535.1 helix-turn-helix transcriptional regulator [Bacilli bacterium]